MSKRLQGSTDDVDDNEEEEEEDYDESFRKKKKRRFNHKSAKKLAFSPFNKLHKFYKKHTRSKAITKSSHSPFFNSSPIVNSSSGPTGGGKRSGKYLCCLCMSKNQTLGTHVDGIDPCEPGVDYGSLKTLIETNDFYSKECNTHLAD